MKKLLRWTSFTITVVLIGLTISFGLLFLGRLYVGMQQPAFLFAILVFFSMGVTVSAIHVASKLDEEFEQAERQKAAQLAARRDLARGDDLGA